MKNFILIIILLAVSPFAFSEETPGLNLLNYFSANCRSEGEWTKAALADSQALASTLRDLSKDPDCQSVGGAIAGLDNLSAQLNNLSNVSYTQESIAKLNAQEQELMVQLSQSSNSKYLDQINSNLLDIQVQRAGFLAQEKSQKDLTSPSKVQILSGLVTTANSTFNQIASNQKCLQKNPNVLNTATAVMAAVGATAAMVNPALGLGLTAGSMILGATIEGVRKMNLSHDLRKLTDGSIALEAYSCALETMSDRWCQMKDAESFMNFKAEQRYGNIMTSDLGKAVRLNDREIPVLIDWLNLVKSGVAPTNSADASRRNGVLAREAYVRTYESTGIGLIEQNRDLFKQATNDIERWNIIRGIVNSLAPSAKDYYNSSSSSSNVKNPLYDIYSQGYSPFFLLGVDDGPSIQSNGNYISIDIWNHSGYVPDLDKLKVKYLDWINKARILVNQELSQVIQPDPLQTLSIAFDKTRNRWKTSPMDAIKTIIIFLEKNPPTTDDVIFNKIYASTLLRLKEIYGVTMNAVVNWDEGNVSDIKIPVGKTPIEVIYDKASLQYGTVVIEARLDLIVRIALFELLKTSPPDDQVLVAQLLASDRFTETLSSMSGDNLSRVRQDIDNGREITINNLDTFADLFGKNLNRILARLYSESNSSTGTIATTQKRSLARMCHLLLGVPHILNYVNVSYCQGSKMDPLIKGGPETKPLNVDSYKQDLNDRACVYREFFRQNKIFENWGIRP
jgi:hypothetical protein